MRIQWGLIKGGNQNMVLSNVWVAKILITVPLSSFVCPHFKKRLEAVPVQHRRDNKALHKRRVGGKSKQSGKGAPCRSGAVRQRPRRSRRKQLKKLLPQKRPKRRQKTLRTEHAWKSSTNAAPRRTRKTRKSRNVPRLIRQTRRWKRESLRQEPEDSEVRKAYDKELDKILESGDKNEQKTAGATE